MTSVSLPAQLEARAKLRALNAMWDLPQVADLIETCFSTTIDGEGRRYVREMRRAAQSSGLRGMAKRLGESVTLPLSGYVWEEDGRLIGNASLIPFRNSKHRIHLIANVAVHPDRRRRGIGRALTARAMQHAWEHGSEAAWLSVRADNPAALDLYRGLGFSERARRTSWTAPESRPEADPATDAQVGPRRPEYWKIQREWLSVAYPEELAWHRRWDFSALRPGFVSWISTLLLDFGVEQWAISKAGRLQAVLAYLPGGHETVLFPAIDEAAEVDALTHLLLYARRHLPTRPRLSLDFPEGRFDGAIRAAGFVPQRVLVWMRATPATRAHEHRRSP